MSTRVGTHEAKTHLSRLLAQAASGDEIIICHRDEPIAKLVAMTSNKPAKSRPKVGTITAKDVAYAADAFAPMSPDELRDWGL